MARFLAVWHAGWYELDRPIAVGQTAEFQFFRSPPPYVKAEGMPVFFHGHDSDSTAKEAYSRRLHILRITHPELGSIRSIETDDLDYRLTMMDGRVADLNAEEDPGTIFFLTDSEENLSSNPAAVRLSVWSFLVEAEVIQLP